MKILSPLTRQAAEKLGAAFNGFAHTRIQLTEDHTVVIADPSGTEITVCFMTMPGGHTIIDIQAHNPDPTDFAVVFAGAKTHYRGPLADTLISLDLGRKA